MHSKLLLNDVRRRLFSIYTALQGLDALVHVHARADLTSNGCAGYPEISLCNLSVDAGRHVQVTSRPELNS